MNQYSRFSIPTYVMNLSEREDRKSHAEKEFSNREEFDLHIIPSIKCERGADGLWKTFRSIVKFANESCDDVIIICEDDHSFTPNYERELFIKDLVTAANLGTQLMWGGIGNFKAVVPVTERLFWVDWSWCAQFTVLFRSAFEKILNARFEWGKDVMDEFLCTIIPNKMVLYPFISIQKEFGYSDVTEVNKTPGFISSIFDKTNKRLEKCRQIGIQYKVFPIEK